MAAMGSNVATDEQEKRFEVLSEDVGESLDTISQDIAENSSLNIPDKMAEGRDLNLAIALKEEGNLDFKQEKYTIAIEKYTSALKMCPLDEDCNRFRAIFLNNRAVCFLRLGRLGEAKEDCNMSITTDPTYIKAYSRRSQVFEKQEELENAMKDIDSILEIDPNFKPAINEKLRLGKLVEEKQEQMKAEMMGKLKSFGNVVLGKFGMSTDNFQMVKDPNTGSYSINYQP